MRKYNKIAFIENGKRIKKLYEFRELIIKYFENIELYGLEIIENEKAEAYRSEINKNIEEIKNIVSAAGLNNLYEIYIPIKGIKESINIIENIFTIISYLSYDRNEIERHKNILLDFIDRAIGVYENNKIKAFIRLFNPLFWIYCLVVKPIFYIISIVFNIDEDDFESSHIGKIMDLIIKILTLVSMIKEMFLFR